MRIVDGHCSCCGDQIDYEEEPCACSHPEDYVRPGTETRMYVNAYEITRHYGGPQEGGWFYNHREPLASIPIVANSIEGHDEYCRQCFDAREKHTDETGELIPFCRYSNHLVPKYPDQVEVFKKHLLEVFGDVEEGDIYSVNGGAQLCIVLEDHEAESNPRPHYE